MHELGRSTAQLGKVVQSTGLGFCYQVVLCALAVIMLPLNLYSDHHYKGAQRHGQ